MEPYLARFEPDRKAGGYVVAFPDFGYGATQGETEAEAVEMAQDLLMLTIGDYIRESRQLPAPKRHRGSMFRPVPLPAMQAAKVDLYTAFLESPRSGTYKTSIQERTDDAHARVYEIGAVSGRERQAVGDRCCRDEAVFDRHGFPGSA